MGRAEDLLERVLSEGEHAIDIFIEERDSENLFLDFKRSADNGAGRTLHQNDRRNLAKAISGFGNSAGGLVVWGVDCSADASGADTARMKVPLIDPKKFLSQIEGAVSGCTIPPHSGVQNRVVESADGQGGFVLTYVPESSHAPHQAIQGKQYYYIRAGSDFVPAPHQVLAGMFGRKPTPNVINNHFVPPGEFKNGTAYIEFDINLRNEGAVLAREPYVTLWFWYCGGSNCQLACKAIETDRWDSQFHHGRFFSAVGLPGFRLAPRAFSQVVKVSIRLSPPFTQSLKFEAIVGCEGMPSLTSVIDRSPDFLQHFYDDLATKAANGLLRENDLEMMGPRLLGSS